MVVPDSAGLSRLDEGLFADLQSPLVLSGDRAACIIAVTVVFAKTLSRREINRLHTLNRSSKSTVLPSPSRTPWNRESERLHGSGGSSLSQNPVGVEKLFLSRNRTTIPL